MLNARRWLLPGLALAAAWVASPARASIETAIDYLALQQAAGGEIASPADPATPAQATAEALRALRFVAASARVDEAAALDVLDAAAANTETLARAVVAGAGAGRDVQALLGTLLAHQNADGGFGDFAGFDSNVLDTAFALDALAAAAPATSAVAPAVGYLLAAQHGPGGFSLGVNPPSAYLTALAMRALWHYRNAFAGVGDALAGARAFLLAERGGTGALWGQTFVSALALIALVPQAAEFAEVDAMLAALRASQGSDGSWDGSVYTTALALRALASQPTTPPPLPTTGAVTGRVLDAATRLPVGGASIAVDALALVQAAGADGRFTLDGLDPATYTLRVSAAGYADRMLGDLAVSAGTTAGVGDIVLTPLPSSGVLQGRVSDAGSGQPLGGAVVAVSGAASATAVTNAAGDYLLAPLTPGPITITVARDGYFPVVAAAQVTAGVSLVFNPALSAAAPDSEPLPGVPETGVVRGVVTDLATGLGIGGAVVLIREAATGVSRASAVTASNGAYELPDQAPGAIRISVSRGGYQSAEATGTLRAGTALVFSPALAGAGETGTGDLEEELLPGTPDTGALQGVISDAATGLPLAGASVDLSGANTASVQSGADGSYFIGDLAPGPMVVSVSLAGYLGVMASGEVAAGNAVVFSPALTADGAAGAGTGRIAGRVVDAAAQTPLRTVLVSAAGDAGTFTTTTDAQGGFALDDLEPGNYLLTLAREGYFAEAFSAVVAGGGTVELGTVALRQALNSVSFYGRITDGDTGAPIEQAIVGVLGSALSARSDAAGAYRIDGLDTGAHTLVFSATGYNSQTLNFSFAEGGVLQVDRALTRTGNAGVGLSFLSTDRSVYGAYAAGTMLAGVQNNGPLLQAMVTFSLYDAGGRLIGDFAATRPGDDQTLIEFAGGGSIDNVESAFDTANLVPGVYRVIARVLVGDQMVGPVTAILAERVTEFSIEATRALAELDASLLPAFSAVGVEQPLQLLVSLVNRSNVDQQLRLSYRLRSPSGTVVRAPGTLQLALARAQDSLSLVLDDFSLTFDEAGEFALELLAVTPVPASSDTGGVRVAPALRIDPSQTLAPGVVTPDGDQRLRIGIRLQGREVQ